MGREYSVVLKEYEEAKAAAEKCRAQVGKTKIQSMVPCFRQLQQNQLQLDDRRKHLSTKQEEIRVAKNTYNQSMRNLDRISTAVHHARREHAEKVAERKPAPAPEDEAPTACPEQDHPAAETGEEFAFGELDDCPPLPDCGKVMETGGYKADGTKTPGTDGSKTPEVTGDDGEDGPFS